MPDQLYRIPSEYTSREPTHLRGPIERPRWRPCQRHLRNYCRQFPRCWGSGDNYRLFKSADPGFYWKPTPARVATPLPAFKTMSQRLPTTLPEQPSFPQSTTPPPPPSCQPASAPTDLSVETPPPPPLRPATQPCIFHLSIMGDSGIFSKESQRIIDQFSTDIDGRELSCRVQGVVNPENPTPWSLLTTPSPLPIVCGLDPLPCLPGRYSVTNLEAELNPPRL